MTQIFVQLRRKGGKPVSQSLHDSQGTSDSTFLHVTRLVDGKPLYIPEGEVRYGHPVESSQSLRDCQGKPDSTFFNGDTA